MAVMNSRGRHARAPMSRLNEDDEALLPDLAALEQHVTHALAAFEAAYSRGPAQGLCNAAIAAMPAVSVRRMRGPSRTPS